MGRYWLAVEAVTGYPIAPLPDFSIDTLKSTIGRAETMTGTLPINPADSSAPENWIAATDPWCVAILNIDDSITDPMKQVRGGGYVNQRIRTHGDVATVPLVTAEGALARRQYGNYTPTATDQNQIAWQLVSQFAATSSAPGLNGMPITLNVVGAPGTVRDRTYSTQDRKTVLAALTELMGVQGGPEFRVTWQHLTNPERWLPVFNIGTMLGTPVTPGLGPAVTFELGGTIQGGTVTDLTNTEDYTDGNGGNYVTAYSVTDATTGVQPSQSVAYTGNPRQLQLDYVWMPSSSITDNATLLAHAQQKSALIQTGTRTLALSVQGNVFPQFGFDYDLGDVVGYRIGGVDQDGNETVPGFPGGLTGTTRVIGVEEQPDVPSPVTTPILGGV